MCARVCVCVRVCVCACVCVRARVCVCGIGTSKCPAVVVRDITYCDYGMAVVHHLTTRYILYIN